MTNEVPPPCILKLSCSVQNYAWGKIGFDSTVAQLTSNSDPHLKIMADKPYAELWMGVHAKGPSTISYPPELNGVFLGAWLSSNKWALGNYVEEKFNGQFPFLFKVLSINKALSIQAHPNKETAIKLNAVQPNRYTDPNHKPEMVIALTDFKGMCGFRPVKEIKKFVAGIPQLSNVLSVESVSKIKNQVSDPEDAIKSCFKDLMNQNEEVISEQLKKLMEDMKVGGDSVLKDVLDKEEMLLLNQLYSWFPNDVGCFCFFFLNVVTLHPGESMFLGPNIPHAYISGDVIECMANSDNVIRAGLTPKYRDKETLCNILDYSPKPLHEQLFHSDPHPVLPKIISIYDPPVPEFTIARILVNNQQKITVPGVNGPSVLIVIEGCGLITTSSDPSHLLPLAYRRGEVLFVPPAVTESGSSAKNSFTIEPKNTTLIYQAFCEG